MSKIYQTSATASAGRNGLFSTEDKLVELNLSYPKRWVEAVRQRTQSNCLQPAMLLAFRTRFCTSLVKQSRLKRSACDRHCRYRTQWSRRLCAKFRPRRKHRFRR